MVPNLKIRLKESKPPDLTRDFWRIACKRAFKVMGEYWHRVILPRHFTPQARYTYGHKPRSRKFKDRKERLAAAGKVAMGGQVDNVFTGRTLAAIKESYVVRGFPTRVRVSMFGPDYLKINYRKAFLNGKRPVNQPNKKKEITTLAKGELQELLEVFKRVMIEEVRRFRAMRVTEF